MFKLNYDVGVRRPRGLGLTSVRNNHTSLAILTFSHDEGSVALAFKSLIASLSCTLDISLLSYSAFSF